MQVGGGFSQQRAECESSQRFGDIVMYDHQPVMLEEVLQYMIVNPNGKYIDGTYGRGGHAQALLNRLESGARLLAFDKDPEAVASAMGGVKDPRLNVVQASFADLAKQVEYQGWMGKVEGILLDLGVSSPQLDNPERGFSFLRDGPLDMRMDNNQGQTAADWLAIVKNDDLVKVFRTYGEERYAKRIARAIIEYRESQPITRTKQLADIIAKAHPAWEKHQHPATRCFQAIRIFINKELEDIEKFLDQVLDVLAPGGRLCVLSFHSLEDRIVKKFIQYEVKGDPFPSDFPITHDQCNPRLRMVANCKPTQQEIDINTRSRSARLRVAEKL